MLREVEILSVKTNIDPHKGNKMILGDYQISESSFKLFLYEKNNKIINVYKIDFFNKNFKLLQKIDVSKIESEIENSYFSNNINNNYENKESKEEISSQDFETLLSNLPDNYNNYFKTKLFDLDFKYIYNQYKEEEILLLSKFS